MIMYEIMFRALPFPDSQDVTGKQHMTCWISDVCPTTIMHSLPQNWSTLWRTEAEWSNHPSKTTKYSTFTMFPFICLRLADSHGLGCASARLLEFHTRDETESEENQTERRDIPQSVRYVPLTIRQSTKEISERVRWSIKWWEWWSSMRIIWRNW